MYRSSPQPADADLNFTGLLPPTLDSFRDRFDLVEGLSGWKFNDILRGDDQTTADLAAIDATSGLNNALNVLAQRMSPVPWEMAVSKSRTFIKATNAASSLSRRCARTASSSSESPFMATDQHSKSALLMGFR